MKVSEKTTKAIKFISENPNEDDYVQKHFRQFMTNGEYDDNSITLSKEWIKQYMTVVNILPLVSEMLDALELALPYVVHCGFAKNVEKVESIIKKAISM